MVARASGVMLGMLALALALVVLVGRYEVIPIMLAGKGSAHAGGKQQVLASPNWLEVATNIQKSGYVAGDQESSVEEARLLRGKLQDAQKELEDAWKQLEIAEGGSIGKDDMIVGTKVSPMEEVKVKQDGARIWFSKTNVKNGETVRIHWTGILGGTADDFIALYLSPESDNHDYLEKHPVTECSTWYDGRGWINIRLFNHRVPGGYEVRYFRKGSFPNDRALFVSTDSNLGSMVFCPNHHCHENVFFLVSVSGTRPSFPAHEPTQVRLSMTSEPTEMRVMWVSEACPGKPFGGAVVLFSEESCVSEAGEEVPHCRYEHRVKPSFTTYTADDLCGAPANTERAQNFLDPGYIYDAVMTSLEPGRRYFYRVGCQDAPGGWSAASLGHANVKGWPAGLMMSDEMSFVAPPWVGKEQEVSFIAYGDSGVSVFQGNGHTTNNAPENVNSEILKHVSSGSAGMVLHLGDISYAMGRAYVWEQWGKLVEPIASQVPFMVTVGNHEYDHLPGTSLSLIPPASSARMHYRTWSTPDYPFPTSLERVKGTIIRGGGNYFKGTSLAADFCFSSKPDGQEIVSGKVLYEHKIVVLYSSSCSILSQASVAELYGASAVIIITPEQGALQLARNESDPSFVGDATIPVVLMSQEDGKDVIEWIDDHSVRGQEMQAEIRSSYKLQANDPSLPDAVKAREPAGFHPSWGNYGDDGGGECGVPFSKRFHMPDGKGNGNFWYSFDYGSVRVIVVSSEHDYRKGSVQYSWIKDTLLNTDRAMTPWVVVAMHRSIYGRIDNDMEQNVSDHMQQHLEPLFRDHKVDLVLSGHEHRYLRTAPVYKDLNMQSSDEFGVTYAVVGTGGARLVYRARDEVHRHFYCVGGLFYRRRCGPCASDDFACYDNENCCLIQGTEYSKCGYCERINATGPGDWRPSSPAGPRDPKKYGWQRKMLSDFGFVRVTASKSALKLEFVESLKVNHEPTVDELGRSLHLEPGVQVGCKEDCSMDAVPSGKVVDSVTILQKD
ncbi:hypothetical protein GUITHDRAFT_162129 [Guillardia theta CCMP2712]|uniref:Purple acid phosphatase n=2 Tax=Guillardia theta TaxID=55529 RepID=L1JM98_GUITC|nr:hypothetical protein GUITHDRAFT_162129 [Guillardia theta CCMP2712]EKX49285.1 hypothetical protein GUITHDRAFT_162129 [Guillardia theta CCMP2712]|eukprot:XP_005836265.1 hypothetical protein GUITHDRAFT_162129 [Guillardia theta CCMP2712]